MGIDRFWGIRAEDGRGGWRSAGGDGDGVEGGKSKGDWGRIATVGAR